MSISIINMSIKEKTEAFNKFTVEDRLKFLNALSDSDRKKFISDIRQQAVKDFWFHEREAIIEGRSTRDWTPEQIESIMNISGSSGMMNPTAGKSLQIDEYGVVLIDKAGNKSYYGHHMLNVVEHPEYAGDWRNIQALNYKEHYEGAHDGNTSNPTVGFYDVSDGNTKTFDVEQLLKEVDQSLEKGNKDIFDRISKEYPPKQSSIFKSDAEIKAIYSKLEKLTDAEILALKNIEYSMEANGGLVDFNRGLDVANRYNSPDLGKKIGIMSDDAIRNNYRYFTDMTDTDVDTFKAYEYFKLRKVDDVCIEKLGVKSDNTLREQYKFLEKNDAALDKLRTYEYQRSKSGTELTDTKVYFDSEGKVVGLSCYDDVPSDTALELKLSDTENYLNDADMSSKYQNYDTYNKIDKLKACQYDYERTQISDMIDNNVTSQNGIEIMSFDDLKAKYAFINDTTDANVIKELQLAEYRDVKYGTNTSESIELHFDENGKMSCISNQGYETIQTVEIRNKSKLTTTVDDFNKFQSAEYMSSICPEYESITELQKLQLQQIELDARNHDYSKLQQMVLGDTTGNLLDVHIVYDADGNGKWKNGILDIINNDSVTKVNGVPTEQFRNLYDNLTRVRRNLFLSAMFRTRTSQMWN